MKDQHADESDPVRRLLYEAFDAFAPALGETNPACRARHLAELKRLVTEAEAANAALLHPEHREGGRLTGPGHLL